MLVISMIQEISSNTRRVVEELDDSVFHKVVDVMMYKIEIGSHFSVTPLGILAILFTFLITRRVLHFTTKTISARLSNDNKLKFSSLFVFGKYIIYAFVFIEVCDSVGINITPLLTASAALLVGVGLALQTLFQDILSGIFIIIDKTLKVGDVIEIEGQIAKVEEIKLRTTRATTIENKVMIIPNHKYLANNLYNWTQNDKIVKESIAVGVAYGSDTQLVKELLLKSVEDYSKVLTSPEPVVFFENFGDSALEFKVVFSVKKSLEAHYYRSDIRFEIDRLFREHNVEVPFPQRVVHHINNEV